jgi:hypothetical protein
MLPLPSRTHPKNKTWVVYTEELTHLGPMAQVDCAGPLQLLCGTGKPRQSRRIPASANWVLVAHTSPPKSETPALLDPYARCG